MDILDKLYPIVDDAQGNIIKPMKRHQNILQQRAFKKGIAHGLMSLDKVLTRSENATNASMYAKKAELVLGVDKETIKLIYMDAYEEILKALSIDKNYPI